MGDASSNLVSRVIGQPLGWNGEARIGEHGERSALASAQRRERVSSFLNWKDIKCVGEAEEEEEEKGEEVGGGRRRLS